ncbi:MAG: TonB-dependent receptor [Gammaproteobacteria bacterium]|nr:TonB-dependent receptor [Gammaproteobacteria bacterium]
MKSRPCMREPAPVAGLCAALVGVLCVVSAAAAQQADQDAEEKDVLELGRQVVTGSRIRRIDVEEARPVVVITREDIELSGRESVADVLRNNPVNSLGSSRERSSNAWIGQATVSIHGIGANRTLVLLDGRRMPRSPVTANQAVDLNIIPLAAVERVEILTDSASAIYGSDAIGGVVNIILRKDYEGMEIRASTDRPTREGADADSGGLTLGGATDRGRFLFSADFRNKRHIASADRFYSLGTTGYEAGAAAYPNAPFPATWYAWENADNVSSWGNTLWPHQLAAPNCEQVVNPATGQRLLSGPYVAANGEEHCGFHYATSAWETTDLNRASVFLHADYELTPDLALRLQSLFSTQDVHGRFAPPPGDIPLDEAAAAGLNRGFGFDVPYPELLPYTLRHRFAGMGNRDFEALLALSETALLAYGSAGIFSYELEARHTRYDGREDSCCFPKAFTTLEYVSQGLYNPFDPLHPGNAGALAAIAANSTRESRADLRSYSGNVSFDLFRASGGSLGWAFGFDYFDELYQDIYDPLSAGGDLLGRAGVSGAGERRIRALFGEVLAPLLPGLELSAALRWDQYDDSAGSELSSYLSVRYQPVDWLLLRASWGEGFRAGSMNNLYDGASLWLQTGFDLVKCRRDGIAPSECIEGEFPTYTGGNPTLSPELSDSYNLGVVVAWNSLTARADFWNVDLENGIGLPPLQGLIGLEFERQCIDTGRIENTRYSATPAAIVHCGSGSLLKRDPATGTLLEADVFWDNTYRAQFRGVDLQLIYELPTAGLGDFQFRAQAGTILRLRTRSRIAVEWSSGLGAISGAAAAAGARPADRSSMALIWRYGDHTVSGYIHYVGGFGLPEAEFSISEHTEFDLFYQWSAPWDGLVTVGVKNLTDEDPELGSFRTPLPQAYNLYGLDGRVLYASYRQLF